jgi:hypothetical protein
MQKNPFLLPLPGKKISRERKINEKTRGTTRTKRRKDEKTKKRKWMDEKELLRRTRCLSPVRGERGEIRPSLLGSTLSFFSFFPPTRVEGAAKKENLLSFFWGGVLFRKIWEK